MEAGLRVSRRLQGKGSSMSPSFSAGVHYVFDMTIAADFSILESQKEFVRRYQQHSEEEPALPMLSSACPGERPEPAASAVCLRRPFSWVCTGGRRGGGEARGPCTLGFLDQEGVKGQRVPSRLPEHPPPNSITRPLADADQPPPPIQPDICCIQSSKLFKSVYV